MEHRCPVQELRKPSIELFSDIFAFVKAYKEMLKAPAHRTAHLIAFGKRH